MRKSLTAAVLAAAALPVLLTGCQAEVTAADGTKATVTGNGTSSSTAPSGDAAGSPHGAGQSGNRTSTGQARARTEQARTGGSASRACNTIKARIKFQPEKRQNMALIAITNTSSRACATKGWPGLRFFNAANEQMALRATRLEVPGVPQRLEVAAGGTVYAAMKWKPCDKAETNCNVVSSVSVFAPGGTRRVVAPLPEEVAVRQSFTIAKGSLDAGILTQTPGEALMWEDDGA
jgi:hypothetical protein